QVVDCGIAKRENHESRPTNVGMVKGKCGYMSPQQCLGHPLDRRSDVFSTAIVLFEMVAGRRLYSGGTDVEAVHAITERPVPRLRAFAPRAPVALEKILARALAKERRDRYATALEMARALERFARAERLAGSDLGLADWLESLLGRRTEGGREPTGAGVAARESDYLEVAFDEARDATP